MHRGTLERLLKQAPGQQFLRLLSLDPRFIHMGSIALIPLEQAFIRHYLHLLQGRRIARPSAT
ncbi:MAG: hypothetical protein ABSG47_19360 [Terracidiphilus sp.]